MSQQFTQIPEGFLPENNSGWFDIPSGQSSLVDAARSRSYSSQFSTKADAFFLSLVTDNTDAENKYLRGLQIIHFLGLLDLITPYWSQATELVDNLGTKLANIVTLQELKSLSETHKDFSKFCERIIEDTSIDSTLITITNEETASLGTLQALAKGCIYYYIILGELSNAGGLMV